MPTSSPTTYAVAHNLKGFRSTTLRVKVVRAEGSYRWVVTADMLDAGTSLVLDANQVVDEAPETVQIHRNGFVAFA